MTARERRPPKRERPALAGTGALENNSNAVSSTRPPTFLQERQGGGAPIDLDEVRQVRLGHLAVAADDIDWRLGRFADVDPDILHAVGGSR